MSHNSRFLHGVVVGLLLAATATASTGYDLWNWYLVPSVASNKGLSGTYWRTDLAILNPYPWKVITVKVRLLKEKVDNTAAAYQELTVPAGGQLLLVDVVKSQFGFEGKGALELRGAGGERFSAVARTYNTATSGTYGQAIDGQSFVSEQGGIAFTAGVRNGGGFRANIGAVNASAVAITLLAEVIDATGVLRATKTFSLLPWSTEQVAVGSFAGEIASCSIRWRCTSTDAGIEWVAYASVVDNASGDAVYLEERADYSYTQVQPSTQIGGFWTGNLVINDIGPETVTARLYQTDAAVSGYLYNAGNGCREVYVTGYEAGGVVTFTGRPYLYPYRNEQIWGTATVLSSTAITGTFTGTGIYANGGSFSFSKTSSFAPVTLATEPFAAPRTRGGHAVSSAEP